MSNSRPAGISLLLVGLLILMGTNTDLLPAEAFWAGLLTYPIGAYLFMKGNRQALRRAEVRTHRALNPRVHNQSGDAFASQQAARPESGPQLRATAPQREIRSAAQQASANQILEDEIVLYEVDEQDGTEDAFAVTSDVSFPLEVQEQSSLADQLEKLRRLLDDDLISEEEFSTAKARLLS